MVTTYKTGGIMLFKYHMLNLLFFLLLVVCQIKEKRRCRLIFLLVLFVLNTVMITKIGVIWMYFPFYLFIFLDALSYIRKDKFKKSITVLSVILILMTVTLLGVFWIRDIPIPSGDFFIGTKTYIVTDELRTEEYNEEGGCRKFKIQIWYPTDDIQNVIREKWLYDGKTLAYAMSNDNGLPDFLFSHLSVIDSNSYRDAKLSAYSKNYPLILLSHGWRGSRNLHQDFAEELASNGYIVVGIDHSYGAISTILDGLEVKVNYEALPVGNENFIIKANQLVNTYAGDIRKSIDFLEKLNNEDPTLKGRLEMKKIGLLGHSTGGGADVKVALIDERIKSVIGLDAWVEPIQEKFIIKGLKIPSLFLRSHQWESGKNNSNLDLLYSSSHYKPELYQINNTTHYDFAMTYMYSPLVKVFGYSGKIKEDRLYNILTYSIKTFFDNTLKNDGENKLNIKEYPELIDIKF